MIQRSRSKRRLSAGMNQYVRSVALCVNEVPSFDVYPFSIPAVRNLGELQFHPNVTFLVGENGSGKSTIVESLAISLGFNPEGGSKNFSFSTRSSESTLHNFLRVTKGVKRPKDGFFLRAESYFNVGTEIERLDNIPGAGPPITPAFGDVSIHEQSHGESFLRLARDRFRGDGVYILDEPEAALSPSRQLAFLVLLDELVNSRSQLIIATHSPIIMAYPDAQIFHLNDNGIDPIAYDDTEHVRITRDFLKNPELFLRRVLTHLE